MKKYLTEEERKAARRESQRKWAEKNKEKISKRQAEYCQINKEKIAKRQAEYYKNNKEKKAAYNAEWRQKNKEKIAEWRQKNKEKIAKQQAEWYQNNKEKILERRAEYYQNNKEKIAEYNAEYNQNNKEKIAKRNSEYGGKYRLTPFGRASNLLKAYSRSDKKYNRGECTLTPDWIIEHIFSQPCHYCGRTDWLKIGCDRIDNSLPHIPDNVVPCCTECNTKRGTTPYEEYLKLVGKSNAD